MPACLFSGHTGHSFLSIEAQTGIVKRSVNVKFVKFLFKAPALIPCRPSAWLHEVLDCTIMANWSTY